MVRRTLLCVLIFFAVQAQAMAASYPVIVQVKPLSNILNIANTLGGTILDSIPGTNIYLLGIPNLSLLQSLNPLLSLLGVQFIEYDRVIAAPAGGKMGVLSVGSATAADWYKAQPSFQLVRANAAQTYSRGRGIVVADLNSKIDYGHPALTGHLTGGYDFVGARASYAGTLDQSSSSFLDQSSATFLDQSSATFLDQSSATFLDQSAATFLDQSAATFLDANANPAYSHGTLCAGIIAAVAPESMIMPLRVFDEAGNADVFTIAKATYHAVQHGARVINMSFGMNNSYNSVKAALAYAASKNVQVIASAGNQNTSTPQFPASVSSVIAVAATDLTDAKTGFSNYGASIFVDAPGANIVSAFPGGYYAMVSGTSFSAPVVAAQAALVMSVKYSNAKTIIGATTVNIDSRNPSYVGKLGKGRVDVFNAVKP